MASVQKRGKTYQYTVSHLVNGKQKPIRKGGFRTKAEAKVAAATVEAELAKGINPSQEKIPFTEYFERWITLYRVKKVSSITLKHYEYSLKAIKDYFSTTAIQDIKRYDYQEFLNDFGKSRAKETIAKVNCHVKSCVRDAIEEHLIQFDFTRKTELTWSVQAKKPADKYLDYLDSKRLMNIIWSKRHSGLGYSLLMLALASGMRFKELIGLTRKDFNFVNNTISINKTWAYKKNSPHGFGPTKNEQSNRVIAMDKRTMSHFKELFKTQPANILQLVFYSSSSKYSVISNTNANKLLKSLLQQLNISPIITVHGLRHTHASVLLYKKASIYYVSERLGHSDIETTLNQYTHVLNELRLQDEQIALKTFESLYV